MEPKVYLVDTNPHLVEQWRMVFASCPDVSVSQGDILSVAENAIVSPANGRGFMDGGIDAEYLSYFGGGIQELVIDEVNKRDEGYLPVGASAIINTKNNRIPFLILAPTMVAPEPVPNRMRIVPFARRCALLVKIETQ